MVDPPGFVVKCVVKARQIRSMLHINGKIIFRPTRMPLMHSCGMSSEIFSQIKLTRKYLKKNFSYYYNYGVGVHAYCADSGCISVIQKNGIGYDMTNGKGETRSCFGKIR